VCSYIHLAALSIWRRHFHPKARPAGRIFVEVDGIGLNVDHLAAQLRDDLKRAAIDRPKLFAGSKNRLRMRAHDLRATFITVSVANGRTWEWCQQRTGHGDSMKQKYRRTAATWLAQKQGDLAPLHEPIPELAEHVQEPPANTRRLPVGHKNLPGRDDAKPMKVHGKGVEPLRLAAAEPKSAASASFATRAVCPSEFASDPSRRFRLRQLGDRRGAARARQRVTCGRCGGTCRSSCGCRGPCGRSPASPSYRPEELSLKAPRLAIGGHDMVTLFPGPGSRRL
jgi:hypothetical protein